MLTARKISHSGRLYTRLASRRADLILYRRVLRTVLESGNNERSLCGSVIHVYFRLSARHIVDGAGEHGHARVVRRGIDGHFQLHTVFFEIAAHHLLIERGEAVGRTVVLRDDEGIHDPLFHHFQGIEQRVEILFLRSV